MDLQLKGKRALVTGAGRGIGRAIAWALAQEGVHIAAAARTPKDVNALIKDLGGTLAGHQGAVMDLTKEGAPQKLLKNLKKNRFGTIDIVIHNLGGLIGIKDPFCSIADWRKVYRLNFEVAVELNRLLIPVMQKQKWGRAIHISSISAMENHGPVTYCAIKAALTAYTRSMGGVVAPDGVVVSALLPGAVFTQHGYWDQALKSQPEHVKKFLTDRQRIGRFGKPEEIADFVTFLCSPLASFNTGSIIPIDGGQGRGYFGQ